MFRQRFVRGVTFRQAQAYLEKTLLENVSGRSPSRLERMRALLDELGDPQLAYRAVHVAGTSGKGSTCTMIADVLQSAGLNVGLHTKPHLHSVTERAKINGIAITSAHFGALIGEMMPVLDHVA